MKKIILVVATAHFFLLLWMALWTPLPPVKKKPLKVSTVVKSTPPPKAAPSPQVPVVAAPLPVMQPISSKKPQPAKKTLPRKVPSAPVSSKASPVVPQKLLDQLKQSLAKIDEKPQKVLSKKPLTTPKSITTLKVDEIAQEIEDGYVSALIECLQSTLDLPEVGEVKLELTLSSDGSFVKTKVINNESDRNRVFLEHSLKGLRFPSFTGQLKQEKEHTFVLSFFNS